MITFTKAIGRIFNNTPLDPEAKAWEAEVRRAIRELKSLNDRELNDIGIARSEIEHAVRYGIAKNDSDFAQRAA